MYVCISLVCLYISIERERECVCVCVCVCVCSFLSVACEFL